MAEKQEWGLVQPFWIDTDAYSDRDREMFCCGVEFQMVCQLIEEGWTGTRPIHPENESRIRMLCARRKVACSIAPPFGGWSQLTIGG